MICYTAIIGHYDDLKDPLVITPDWKYVCFTDQVIKSDVWDIRKVDCFMDPKRVTNRYKVLFHEYVQDDLSIWVDASFYINCDLSQWVLKHAGPYITFMKHPERECFYREAQACIELQKDNPETILRQMNVYRTMGLKENSGMVAAGIICRFMSKPAIAFCEQWYWYMQRGSKRDQLAWPMAAQFSDFHTITDWNYTQTDDFLIVPHYNRPAKRQYKLAQYKKKGLIK